MFFNNHPKVREYFISLINDMASEYQGRSYLLQREDMIPLLVDEITKEPLDTYFRQNVLGTLQKFSLRKFAQTTMIECNVI